MRKILSIFTAMLCAIAVNAAVIQITPTSPHSSDNLRQALNDAATGDIIEMASGTYEESPENYIAFTGKEVTVRAAEGANVVIVPKVPIRLKSGARAEFIGVKFDCGHLSDVNSYSHMIVPADNSDGKRVILNDCEFYNWQQVSSLIQTPSDRKLDSLVIENCYFHDCYQSCLHYTNANLVGLEIKNSLFANITIPATGEYWAAPIHVAATTGTVLVDHCTFYNVVPRSLGYGVITTASGSAVVSNCIFMLPESADMCATNLPEGGEVKNSLTFQYDNWQPYGHYTTATVTNCIGGDPLFADAAHGDFYLREGSPALTAGMDGGIIGACPAAQMKTLYCKMEQDWWKDGGAAVGFYTWDDKGIEKAAWPGERMTPVEGEADLWSIEVNIAKNKMGIFTRMNPVDGDNQDWGAKTQDLTFPTDDNDMFTIANTLPCWDGEQCACDGTWAKYVPAGGGEEEELSGVIYDWTGEVGTTIPGTTGVEISTVKIHTNTDAVPGIKFGSSYVYADGKYIAIKPVKGAFKAGDVLSVAAVFNNADNTKYAQVDVYAADGATRLFRSDSASTINGRTSAAEPIIQTYTLEADQDSLLLGRYGNTGMFITLLKVERGGVAPQPEEGYYIVGTMNNWTPTADDAYKFAVNPENEGEFVLHYTLAENDVFKVVEIASNSWYPAEGGEASNYVVDAAHAGEKDIYFRPDYQGGADWHYGCIYVAANEVPADAPAAAPTAPTYAGYQVKAVYSATYNADCDFGEWGSGTQYTQEEYGKKYVTAAMGYFGLAFTGMDCSTMEALHLDVWIADDASIRIVPIHGGTEVGVTAQLEGQKWNSIDIALSEFAGVTDWSNVYQIKIDNASNLTFWLNNVYFYTTQEKTVDLVDGYYLIGNINGWDIHNLTADHLFAVNPANEAEYILHYTLAEGNEFKVVAVANNELGAWYPGEAGNYVVDFAHVGEKDIYFRPDYQGGEGWHAGCIFVAADENANPWETWFASGDTWNTETESYLEWDGENHKATVHINVDKYGQWRAQVKYHGPVAEEGKCYRVALKLKSNNAISNVTIKYQDNVEMIYVADAALEAGVEYVFDQSAAGIAGGNGIMILDFGFAHAGDIIEIYDVVIEETECPEPEPAKYYLVGNITNWAVVAEDAYLFVANAENEGEFMLTYTLAENDEIKVVKVEAGQDDVWYPAGENNNYVVDAAHAGEKTIYFRPDGQGGEGWHAGCIYIAPNGGGEGINNTAVELQATKTIQNGMLLIIKGDKTYNVMGQIVK
ncbi:MAG: hypothetical protein IKM83_04920 [Paludibacteraceae bacterium]|nr:hypothetical protein [Paludibacteraceae bacterium]